jgi:ABC-type Fe3+-hydroxamate transport system substrate-binding protein
MEYDSASTRRQFVKAGTGLAVGGALAGCADDADTDSDTEDGAYTVQMSPVGEVAFEEPPEQVFSILSHHADMALALGRGDNLTGVYAVEYTNSLMNAFTPQLDGVSVDWSDLYAAWNPEKEKLYDLDNDIHLADPAKVLTMSNWEQSDIEEIGAQIGPWFGNTFSAEHGEPPEAYADNYQYYGLWEQFEKVAQIFQATDRYEMLRRERDAMRSTIESGLPPESERPSVAMVLPSTSDGSMWTYDVTAAGHHSSHTRPLGATNAFADIGSVSHGAQIDYEALVSADPDVLLILGGVVDVHDMPAIREILTDDPVASEVTAVQDGRIHPMGTRHQGPLVNLFQLEMGAKQLYPEQFGAWPDYDAGPSPEIPEEEQLFDRQTVASAINGEI